MSNNDIIIFVDPQVSKEKESQLIEIFDQTIDIFLARIAEYGEE